ncbi:MAG: iron chelate uptake ABC transporter family permease subunit [Anaerolinea sp.]|nr:iron chelate uptake ABC transporter family permease subunit [Anaerolinea sp.]
MTKHGRPYLWNSIILMGALTASVAIGSVFIPPLTLLRILAANLPFITITPDWPQTFTTILFQVRLPHTVLMALTGAALAGSGAAYQGLFRNPLADPYLIGVASGAGLGAVLMMAWRWPQTWLGFYAVPIAAFVGAAVTVFLVYNLARTQQTVPTTTLILAGVAFSSFATALTSFLMLRSHTELRRALGWLLGGAVLSGWDPVLAVLPYLAVGLGLLLTAGHALNVLQFGEEQAQQLGLSVERTKLILILAASLTTAAAVAFSGIIGFIGLIVPHLMRMTWGSDYKRLIPLSILGGGSALLLADVLARTLLAPQTLPVGVLTALAGAPFFLWILRRAKAQVYW